MVATITDEGWSPVVLGISPPLAASAPCTLRQIEWQCFVGGIFVHVPAGDDAGADHLVAEAGEAVCGVGVEG